MSKELIVSVNGREKKIAIIEDGRVTEFYIERGENSQGIVGNIYKGRVMRVLPGMQSAFVDIGLDRDAFLYVSDFFDEEEEFERIVIDKTKVEGVDGETAARAAAERIERARIEREHQIESAQERAEPILEVEDESGADVQGRDHIASEGNEPIAAASPTGGRTSQQSRGRANSETESKTGAGGGRRHDNWRDRQDDRSSSKPLASKATDSTSSATTSSSSAAEASHPIDTPRADDFATPFIAGAYSFQRVVDEDQAAVEEGEMFKDARLQERLLDQIHAVEFDIDDVATAEVGSLLSTGAMIDTSFQRIDDGDVEPEGEKSRGLRSVQKPVAASIARFAEEFPEESPGSSTVTNVFERVSDDEKSTESVVVAPDVTIAEAGSLRGGRSRSRRGTRTPEAASATADADASQTLAGDSIEATAAAEETPRKARAGRARATKKSDETAVSRSTSAKGRSKRPKEMTAAGDEAALNQDGVEPSPKESISGVADAQLVTDAEASITSPRTRGEFARRGGRRRRRGPSNDTPAAENGAAEEERTNGNGEDAEAIIDVAEVIPEPVAVAPPIDPSASRKRPSRSSTTGDNGRGSGGSARRGGEETRSSGGGGGRDRRDRQQPTITDLLREGQEIIVQIAKEPIAQKGARITSHIALPGRFLVYMPTIEHLGVSRKIESDTERARLRKLIQAIAKDEDIPSGGFIVRTAGVGMSEADLRDDARYLVRTWRDIRRNAEKPKAPALAHRDLDLVQRILRDQLSDDFSAIRVDSDDEYQNIVGFINRIQPRLVKRVKLYTRDEPILEAYGVQAEIDKAIKPRVWLRSGGYLVINQTEALVAIDVNTGKFVGRGGSRLEDTITRTNLEAVEEIARQIRLRDLGGIIVLDLIDMEERRNRNRVMQALQDALKDDKSPTKVLSFNDFGLVIMTRKRVKQSLERTLCSPCPYCQGSSLVKSPQTVCYEVLEEARHLSRSPEGDGIKQTTLRVNPEVARALHSTERDVLNEIEEYLGSVDLTSDAHIHQEQFDFAFI